MRDHRVPLRRRALRRYPDPLRSRDPRVIAVLEQLRTVEVAPPPAEPFRSELRAQLVAITPRIVAEEAGPEVAPAHVRPRPYRASDEAPELPSASRHRSPRTPRRFSVPVARPLRVVATLLVAFVLVLGGATWVSQNSLPGDALYGLKRVSERAELAFDGNDDERARDHLDFAETRIDEARRLLGRAGATGTGISADGRVSDATTTLIVDTLKRADVETRSASELLGDLAVRSASGSPLSTMTAWAPGQVSRIFELWKAMPSAGKLRPAALQSLGLVKKAQQRAVTLRGKAGCGCMKGGPSDSLGPVPCAKCTAKAPAGTRSGGRGTPTSARPSSAAGRPSGSAPAKRSTRPAGSSGAPRRGGASTSSKQPLVPVPTLRLPSGKASAPVPSPTKCINLLDVIHIGKCPSSSP